MYVKAVDKTAIPTREARAATFVIGKVQGCSLKITISTRNRLETITCPVAVTIGDIPHALN
jgi:hypothetical protein